MAGLDPSTRWRLGVSPEGIRQLEDRTMWLRCRATTDEHGAVRFTTLRNQGSHMLSNLALANALARVPLGGSADDQQPPVLSWLDLDAP
jgi:molybdopterin biosynthesis enzyme